MKNEEIISQFLQEAYSDRALCNLLCATEDGVLSIWNTNRCLLGMSDAGYKSHKQSIWRLNPAEHAYLSLSTALFGKKKLQQTHKAMLPIIRAEIARREKLRENRIEFQSTPNIKVVVKIGEIRESSIVHESGTSI